jgi:hypothetical protein
MTVIIDKKTNKRSFEKLLKKINSNSSGLNTKKYCGSITLKESPLEIQKNIRSEWDK